MGSTRVCILSISPESQAARRRLRGPKNILQPICTFQQTHFNQTTASINTTIIEQCTESEIHEFKQF